MDTLTLLVGIGTAAAIGFTFWLAGDDDFRTVFDDTGLDDYLIEDARAATRKDTGGMGAASGSGQTRTDDARTRHGRGNNR